MEVELMVARLHMLSFNQAYPTFSLAFIHSWVWALQGFNSPKECYNVIKQKIASPQQRRKVLQLHKMKHHLTTTLAIKQNLMQTTTLSHALNNPEIGF
jgi:hypothetical protein